MSISSAMSNAVFGLHAAGRGAEVVSNNISNALTPGYSRRTLDLTSALMGGVRVAGLTRHVDAGLVSDLRLADAEHQFSNRSADFHVRFEQLLGTPNNPGSLAARLSSFEASIVAATSRPDAPERLNAVVETARDLTAGLRDASDGVQAARSDADRAIASEVRTLNLALRQVESLNAEITGAQARSAETAGLEDQRQQVIDQIGALVPVRIYQREGGQVALYSTSGTALLERRASTIGFDGVGQVTPYMSLTGGQLSGLTVNGEPVDSSGNNGALGGGSIGGHFLVRDNHGITAQIHLNVYARDLISRFQDPALDATLGAGDAGLFTDEGAVFVPSSTAGIAARIEINAAVDPNSGGESWRLRDGINAVAQGPVGESGLLQAMTMVLSDSRATVGGPLAGDINTSSSLLASITSVVGVNRSDSEQRLSFASTRLSALTEQQLANGVDTDAEMQRLIQVEQAYAANARMISVLDEMMDLLNRL